MTEHTGIHWAESEDLREQFVLGKVTASQRAIFEEHTRGCAECRRLVDEERLIVSGIRAAGRETLREDLKFRLLSRGTTVSHGMWRWVAAAATIVAAVGVWRLVTPSQPGVLVPPELPRIVEQPPVESAPADGVHRAEMPEPARDGRERDGERFAGTEIALEEGRREAAQTRMTDLAGAGARADVAKLEASDAVAPARVEAWTTGSFVFAPAAAAPSMIRQEQHLQRAAEFEAKAQKDGSGTAGSAVGRVATATNVQLRQSSSMRLPADQIRANGPVAGSVPVRLTQVGDSLIIDVYLDPPFTEDGLRTARYLLPKTDSIVVEVEGQKIGIQLPSGFIAR